MAEEIVNKVAKSGLITLSISEMVDSSSILVFDLKPFLWQEIALKEQDFREALKVHPWSIYEGKDVGIYCSIDAIIPQWAYILVSSYLSPLAKSIHFGTKETVIGNLALESIKSLNGAIYADSRVIIKGCGEAWINQAHYVALSAKLIPHVKSLMYGEPCSTVPIYKKK